MENNKEVEIVKDENGKTVTIEREETVETFDGGKLIKTRETIKDENGKIIKTIEREKESQVDVDHEKYREIGYGEKGKKWEYSTFSVDGVIETEELTEYDDDGNKKSYEMKEGFDQYSYSYVKRYEKEEYEKGELLYRISASYSNDEYEGVNIEMDNHFYDIETGEEIPEEVFIQKYSEKDLSQFYRTWMKHRKNPYSYEELNKRFFENIEDEDVDVIFYNDGIVNNPYDQVVAIKEDIVGRKQVIGAMPYHIYRKLGGKLERITGCAERIEWRDDWESIFEYEYSICNRPEAIGDWDVIDAIVAGYDEKVEELEGWTLSNSLFANDLEKVMERIEAPDISSEEILAAEYMIFDEDYLPTDHPCYDFYSSNPNLQEKLIKMLRSAQEAEREESKDAKLRELIDDDDKISQKLKQGQELLEEYEELHGDKDKTNK